MKSNLAQLILQIFHVAIQCVFLQDRTLLLPMAVINSLDSFQIWSRCIINVLTTACKVFLIHSSLMGTFWPGRGFLSLSTISDSFESLFIRFSWQGFYGAGCQVFPQPSQNENIVARKIQRPRQMIQICSTRCSYE